MPSMTVSVCSPRKSNFTRPAFSTGFMSYCVTDWSGSLASGSSAVTSHTGRSAMITPAGWRDLERTTPCRWRAMSSASRASRLVSASWISGSAMVASSSSSFLGMALEIRSVWP